MRPDRPKARSQREKRRLMRRLLLGATVLVASFVYLRLAPDRYNITTPIDLTDKPTIVTEWKLQFAGADRCYAAIERARVGFERLPDEVQGPGCGFENVARLDRSLVAWGNDVTLTCRMLAGIILWERHTLQPMAQELLGSPVARVRHYGTYSCRNVNGEKYGRRSEHATANAIDIAGFALADGQEISVLNDWGKKTAAGRFLDRIHGRACNHFNGVLGPDYNELHRDHFHFDQGDYETCP